jgi:hypothetical protein
MNYQEAIDNTGKEVSTSYGIGILKSTHQANENNKKDWCVVQYLNECLDKDGKMKVIYPKIQTPTNTIYCSSYTLDEVDLI